MWRSDDWTAPKSRRKTTSLIRARLGPESYVTDDVNESEVAGHVGMFLFRV